MLGYKLMRKWMFHGHYLDLLAFYGSKTLHTKCVDWYRMSTKD